ncbi:DUF5906 domain-containing protein [Selenomonas ruminantium]|uniref:DNA primase family protein n=1 Tax=Selenomonas ruminantium TaxID=971 RepID=UPI0026EDE931|nr:DUF5906 domain-containing protein [Selenomonas ruminantium]
MTAHTPDYCSTVQLNVTYDKKAECPRFKQFLAESMGGDMAQVALLQEMLGYFLIPVNSAQKCFVIVGVASAGKSVLLRVLNDILLGKQNVSNVSWQALNERFKTAELFGKLANIFADLPTKNIDDNGIFLFALQGLRRLMGNHYVFSETDKNRAELQQYREESDSVLSFVKEHCVVLPEGEGSVGATELFNAYKGYCEECGLKPYSQKSFVQQMMTSFPHLERKIDRIAKRRVLTGIKLGEILM